MKLVYVDESWTTQESEWLVLGAFIIDANDWSSLQPTLNTAVGGYAWSRCGANLKNIRRPQDAPGEFDDGEPKELSHNVYQALDRHSDYTALSVLINTDRYNPSRWRNLKDEPYEQAYVFLLERVELYLTRNQDRAMVFIDSRGRQDQAINNAHRELSEEGSEFVDFRRVNNISIPLDDEDSYGLQLADWICAGVKDCVIDNYTDEFYEYIKPNLDRNDEDDHLGYGLKIYPDEARQELHGV